MIIIKYTDIFYINDLLVFLLIDVNKTITICVNVLQDNINVLSLLWKRKVCCVNSFSL